MRKAARMGKPLQRRSEVKRVLAVTVRRRMHWRGSRGKLTKILTRLMVAVCVVKVGVDEGHEPRRQPPAWTVKFFWKCTRPLAPGNVGRSRGRAADNSDRSPMASPMCGGDAAKLVALVGFRSVIGSGGASAGVDLVASFVDISLVFPSGQQSAEAHPGVPWFTRASPRGQRSMFEMPKLI